MKCTNDEDHLRLNTSFFNSRKVTSPQEDLGPDFKLPPASKELQNHSKFLMGLGQSPSQDRSHKMEKSWSSSGAEGDTECKDGRSFFSSAGEP